ncbi:hypothetical protein M9978_00250 [Sphingomonas sp. MG17]|uniref:Uncharacterized protein n=1 Tax=Sphingomonas tagetis TaxID=2949092 RepID=A0A9X2KMN4_9SPHN|nr:hypothetical protein [Sphingomonas tagetis]MCP3728848.1 hypothetical protein [Sphingomonas tagetis]
MALFSLRVRSGLMVGSALALGLASAPAALAQATVVRVAPAPPPPPAWQTPDADYRFIDDADALLDAIGDAPPDFTFSYAGGDAWGWRTRTGHEVYAETARDGGERGGSGVRYYYFDPGMSAPFLVYDGELSFGYRDGRVAVAYDRDGRVLSPEEADRYWALAERLYSRGRAIRDAARYEDRWDSADAGWWAWQVASVIQLRLRWEAGRSRHPGWRKWRMRPDSLTRRPGLGLERQSRWAAGARFHRWRQEGFRGPAPQFGGGGMSRPAKGLRPPRQGWRPGMPPAMSGQPGASRPFGPGGAVPLAPAAPGVGRAERPDTGAPGMGRPGRVPPFAGQVPPDPQPQAEPQRRPGGERQGGWSGRRDGDSAGRERPRREFAAPPVAVQPTPAPAPTPPVSRPQRSDDDAGGRRGWQAQPERAAPPQAPPAAAPPVQARPEPRMAPSYVAPPPVYVAPPPPPPPPVYVAPPPPPPPPREPVMQDQVVESPQ